MALVTYTYPNVNPKRQNILADKLLFSGINYKYLEGSREGIDEGVWIKITVDDSITKATVDAVVNTYNPDEKSPREIDTEADDATILGFKSGYQQLVNGLAAIRTDMNTIKNGTNTPNSAQSGAAFKLLADTILKMCTGQEKLLEMMRIAYKRRGEI